MSRTNLDLNHNIGIVNNFKPRSLVRSSPQLSSRLASEARSLIVSFSSLLLQFFSARPLSLRSGWCSGSSRLIGLLPRPTSRHPRRLLVCEKAITGARLLSPLADGSSSTLEFLRVRLNYCYELLDVKSQELFLRCTDKQTL